MPFIEQLPGVDVWTVKSEVRLLQLPPQPDRSLREHVAEFLFGRKVEFEVLRSFGHTRRHGPPFDAPLDVDMVPAGVTTDLASVPSFLWGVIPSYGGHTMAALLHDVQCVDAEYARVPSHDDRGARRPLPRRLALRRRADDLFRRVLREDSGSGPVTSWLMWAAVRVFGSPPSRLALAGVLAVVLERVVLPAVAPGVAETVAPWGSLVGLAATLVGLALLAREDRSVTPDPDALGGAVAAVRSMVAALVVVVLALAPITLVAVTSWVVSRALSTLDFLVDAVTGGRRREPGVAPRQPAARPAPVAPAPPTDEPHTVTAS